MGTSRGLVERKDEEKDEEKVPRVCCFVSTVIVRVYTCLHKPKGIIKKTKWKVAQGCVGSKVGKDPRKS